MNVSLRPYRCGTPTRKAFASSLTDPFGFGSGLLDEFLRLTEGGALPTNPSKAAVKTLAINVHEDEKGYTLEVAVPGVNKENIDVSLDEGKLSISVKSCCETEDGAEVCDKEYATKEWVAISGKRTLSLPTDADAESLDAALKDGVLTLKIGRLEEKQPRKVLIS